MSSTITQIDRAYDQCCNEARAALAERDAEIARLREELQNNDRAPPPVEFRARLRWEQGENGPNANTLLIGKIVAGFVTKRIDDGRWNAYGTSLPIPWTKHDTLVAAQSALVAAVMEMGDE